MEIFRNFMGHVRNFTLLILIFLILDHYMGLDSWITVIISFCLLMTYDIVCESKEEKKVTWIADNQDWIDEALFKQGLKIISFTKERKGETKYFICQLEENLIGRKIIENGVKIKIMHELLVKMKDGDITPEQVYSNFTPVGILV